MLFEIFNINGEKIVSNLHSVCLECKNIALQSGYGRRTCEITGVDNRFGYYSGKQYKLFLCCSYGEAKTTKLFREKIEVLNYCCPSIASMIKESLLQIRTDEHDKYSRIVHNLKTLNAQSLLNQYNFIDQDRFASEHDNLLQMVQGEVMAHPKDAAIAILQQSKNNEHMKTEFASHEKLSVDTPTLYPSLHVVQKVILNVYHSFAMDFRAKNVTFRIDSTDVRARFDYDTVRVALYHIFSNAVKYIANQSILFVQIMDSTDFVVVDFKMKSLKIEEEEVEYMFEDHYSGKAAVKAKLNGTGLGMGLIKKALNLNKGDIEVIPGEKSTKISSNEYAENIFKIRLSKR